MYYQVADPSRAMFLGGFTATNAGEIATGKLVVSDTSNALTLAGSGSKPDGIAFTNRVLVPNALRTTLYADAAESVTLVNGANVLVWCDSEFFYGGTLPAVNDTIYSAASGKMATSGSVKLGKCIKTGDYRTPPNSSSNIVCLELGLGGLETV